MHSNLFALQYMRVYTINIANLCPITAPKERASVLMAIFIVFNVIGTMTVGKHSCRLLIYNFRRYKILVI